MSLPLFLLNTIVNRKLNIEERMKPTDLNRNTLKNDALSNCVGNKDISVIKRIKHDGVFILYLICY